MISNLLPTDYQNFIALSRYARWKEDEQRRETWGETVTCPRQMPRRWL